MYRERKLGPKTRLNLNRYNLMVSGVIYTIIGSLFHGLDPTESPELRWHAFVPFLILGSLSVLSGLISYLSPVFARRSFTLHYIFLVLFTANFAVDAAIHGLAAPYFAWSLLGPFAACAAMAIYRKFSLVVMYAWISYGLNILAGAYFGSGTFLFTASNILCLVMVLPTLANLVGAMKLAKEQQLQSYR